jgi:integrase
MPAPSRRKLSRTLLASLAPGEVARDSECLGLQVRRNPGGSLAYRVEVNLGDRKRRVAALDLPGVELHDFATIRERARAEMRCIAEHGCTLAELAERQAAERDASRPVTVADYWPTHRARHFAGRSDKYRRGSEVHFAKYIAPHLGDRPLASLKRSQIAEWHRALMADHGLAQGADRALATLRAMLSAAVLDDLIAANPASRVRQLGAGDPVRRPLKSEEVTRLWSALDSHEGRRDAADLVALLVLTGMRAGEPEALTWRDVDPESRAVTLRRHKTKRQAGTRTVALHREALAILVRHRPESDDAPIFAGVTYTVIRRTWGHLRTAANLGERRLHDLRHTWREWASRTGIPADVAEAAIGHALPGIVGVYSAPPLPALLDAADRVGDALLALRSASGSASTSRQMKSSKSSTR